MFPFPLDGFQRRAVAALLEGKSVVVCAPTGAGKTAIAEAAAAAVLARGQRVIYTTPLKALSNQKLQETRARFGAARCGLQVGAARARARGGASGAAAGWAVGGPRACSCAGPWAPLVPALHTSLPAQTSLPQHGPLPPRRATCRSTPTAASW